jgi:hypothetical protein
MISLRKRRCFSTASRSICAGFDGLAAEVQQIIGGDPFSDHPHSLRQGKPRAARVCHTGCHWHRRALTRRFGDDAELDEVRRPERRASGRQCCR